MVVVEVPDEEGATQVVREQLWTKRFVLALGVSFFISMVFYLLMTSMALYAVHEFSAGEVASGMASSVFVIGAVGSRLVSGTAIARLGQRRVMLAGLVLFALAAATYLVVNSLGLLLAVRVLHGIAFGFAHTAVGATVQSLIPSSCRAEGTGYYGASATLATAIGPFAAVLLLDDYGSTALFLSSTIAAALALVAAIFVGPTAIAARPRAADTTRTADTAGTAPAAPVRARSVLEPRALPIALFMFVLAIGYSGVLAYVNSYAESIDLTSAAAAFFLVYAVVVLALRMPMGRLQDSRGDNLVMLPAIVAFAAGLLVLALAHTPAAFLLSAGLMGLGWGTVMSGGQAIAVASAPIQNVGTVVATFFLLLDLGVGVGPLFLGVLAGATDFRVMYAALAALALLTIALYWFVHGRHSTGRSRAQQPGATELALAPAESGV